MISGSMSADKAFFAQHYRKRLTQHFLEGASFVVGGAEGVDTLAQQFLLEVGCSPERVTVVDRREEDNRLVGSKWLHKSGFSSFTERDEWMTENSDVDVAVVNQYGGGGSGTFANVVRRELGKDAARTVQRLFRENSEPYKNI